jgi:hypothetical protein
MLGGLSRVIGPAIATLVYTSHHAGPYLMAGAITLAVAAWTVVLKMQMTPAPAEVYSSS